MVYVVLAALIVMLFGVKFAGKGQYFEDFLSLDHSKAIEGLFAIIIVFHHLSIEINNSGIVELFSSVGFLAVSIFFFYSGYGLMTSLKTKPNYIKGFLLKRLSSVLIPFFITNILYLIVFSFTKQKYSFWEIARNILGIHLINDYAWFILVILLFYVVFYLMFRFLKEDKAIWGMGIFTLLFITTSLVFNADPWWYNSSIAMFIGIVYAYQKDKMMTFIQKRTWLKLSILCLASLVFFNYLPYLLNQVYPAQALAMNKEQIATIIQISTSVIFTFFFIFLGVKVQLKNKLLLAVGKASLELYLIQRLVILSLKKVPFIKYLSNILPGNLSRALRSLQPSTVNWDNIVLYVISTLIISILLALLLNLIFSFLIKQYKKLLTHKTSSKVGDYHGEINSAQ